MKGKKRVVISLILTFLLSLVIFGIGQYVGLSLSLFDKEKFQDTVVVSGYYRTINEELEGITSDVLNGYGLPTGLGEGLWKQAEINKDMEEYVNSIANELTTVSFVEKIKERLGQRLADYYEGEAVEADEEEWRRMETEIIAMVGYQYENRIQLPFIREYIEFCNRMKQHTLLITTIGIVASLIICVTLCLMYRHKHKAIRYMAYAMVSASLMTMPASYFFRGGMWLDKRFITDVAYRKLCNQILTSGFSYVSLMGTIGIFLGVLLFFLVRLMRGKGKLKILK